MFEFFREMVARGFWWAILASIIFNTPFAIIGWLFGKRFKFFKSITAISGVFFTFYIWHIREHTGWLVLAIITAIGCVISLITSLANKGVKEKYKDDETLIASFLSSTADAANKELPKMADSETRMDKLVALPNRVFQYHFTLVNYSRDGVNPEVLKNQFYLPILNNLKTNSDFKDFRNFKVTLEFLYHDKNGIEILKLTYGPKDYS